MSKLIHITNTSLDGHVEDEAGAFDWVNPDQVHAFIAELLQPIGTHLYGRPLYETMVYWDGPMEGYPPEHRDFARIWQKAQKIVFSATSPFSSMDPSQIRSPGAAANPRGRHDAFT
jgi:hypothetical protein